MLDLTSAIAEGKNNCEKLEIGILPIHSLT